MLPFRRLVAKGLHHWVHDTFSTIIIQPPQGQKVGSPLAIQHMHPSEWCFLQALTPSHTPGISFYSFFYPSSTHFSMLCSWNLRSFLKSFSYVRSSACLPSLKNLGMQCLQHLFETWDAVKSFSALWLQVPNTSELQFLHLWNGLVVLIPTLKYKVITTLKGYWGD